MFYAISYDSGISNVKFVSLYEINLSLENTRSLFTNQTQKKLYICSNPVPTWQKLKTCLQKTALYLSLWKMTIVVPLQVNWSKKYYEICKKVFLSRAYHTRIMVILRVKMTCWLSLRNLHFYVKICKSQYYCSQMSISQAHIWFWDKGDHDLLYFKG